MNKKNTGRTVFYRWDMNPVDRLSKWGIGLTGILAVAFSLFGPGLTTVFPKSPKAKQSAEVGAQIDAKMVDYLSGTASIKAYLVKPKDAGKHPAVIVLQSSEGLNDRIRDVARGFADEGFVALAPDLQSRAPKGGSNSPAVYRSLSATQTLDDLKAGYDFLAADTDVVAAKISAVGFGWGAWRAFMLAEEIPTLDGAVAYYGATPQTGLETIHSPILAHYAQYDFRNTGNAVWTEKTLKESGKKFTYYVYPGAHGDFIDSDKDPHDVEATQLSWKRTLEFLRSSH